MFNISKQASLLFVIYTSRLCLIKCFCEYNDEQLGSVKDREFLDKQSVNFLKYSHKASSENEAVGLYARGSHFVLRRGPQSPQMGFLFIFFSPQTSNGMLFLVIT